MNKTKIIASSILIAVVGGYSWLWYGTATRIASELEQDILLSQTPDSGAIFSCEKIEKGGFPFAITVSLVNPNCTLRGLGNEVVTIPLQGKIKQSYTLLSTLKKIEVEGKLDVDLAKFAGKKEIVSFEGKCSLEAGNKGYISAALKHPIRLMQGKISRDDFEDAKLTFSDCKGTSQKDGVAHDFLQTKLFTLLYKKMAEKQTIDLAADGMIDIRYFPYANEEAMAQVAWQNSPITAKIETSVVLPDEKTLSSLAKNPFQLVATRIPYFSVDIKKLEVTSPCTSYSHTASMSVEEDENNTLHVHGASDSVSKYTAEFYPFMKSYLLEAIKEINENGENTRLTSLLEENKEKLFAVIPRLDLLGSIKSCGKVDITFCKKDTTYALNLQNVGLECAPWGMWMSLHAQNKGDAKKFFMSVDLLKYRSLVTDVINYCNRAFSLYNILKQDADPALHPINEATQQKIGDYLQSLSSKPDNTTADDIKIEVNIEGDKKSVGQFDMQAVSVKTDELVKMIQKNVCPEPTFQDTPKKEEPVEKPAQ